MDLDPILSCLSSPSWQCGMSFFCDTDALMSQEQQMNYNHHINPGGSGCTSWTGIISKMAMPGVLFHQETADVRGAKYFDT
eukprot:8343280-Ditylum_brightwellii.AAC.1